MSTSKRPAGAHPPASILIVDDDEDLRALLVTALRGPEARSIEQANSAAQARQALSRSHFDVVVTDLSMPGEDGLSLMRWALEHRPGPSWIVLTGHGTFDAAVEALQLGAFDFLSKPIRAIESLRNAVRNALEHQRLRTERDALQHELQQSNDQLRGHVAQLEEACRLLRHQADTIRADLQRAGIIQQALLPHVAPSLAGFHVQALYRPSPNVGGDLYDVVRLDDQRVALLLADAAGHGLAAAMLAVLFRSRIPFVDPDTGVPHQPAHVLRAVNHSLCEQLPAPGLFLTAAYCVLEPRRREVTIASAGHPPLLWLRQRGGIEKLLHTGPALGLVPHADFSERRIRLAPGDGLLLYSDGLAEALPGDHPNPCAKIQAALEDAGSGAQALEGLLAPLHERDQDGESPEDDVTVLLLAAAPGLSVLSNGAPKPLPQPDPAVHGSPIRVGRDAQRTVLSLPERGDWSQSAAFHGVCRDAIEAGCDVLVDLTLCRHLDSTFLGTIHQLCAQAERVGVEFRLQGLQPAVEGLFEELGMDTVREHMAPRLLPLPPDMQPLGAGEPDAAAEALLMLRAHEGLAALSDRNREEFDPLLEQLRREVAALQRREGGG